MPDRYAIAALDADAVALPGEVRGELIAERFVVNQLLVKASAPAR
jgi:hypothetical protein